jgi:hypothetical protein
MRLCKWLPSFRRNISPTSSGFCSNAVWTYRQVPAFLRNTLPPCVDALHWQLFINPCAGPRILHLAWPFYFRYLGNGTLSYIHTHIDQGGGGGVLERWPLIEKSMDLCDCLPPPAVWVRFVLWEPNIYYLLTGAPYLATCRGGELKVRGR